MPSLPPESIICTPISSQSLQLTWEDPPIEGRNGLIQGYKLKYQQQPKEGIEAELEEENELAFEPVIKLIMSKSAILHGLQKWTNYSLSLLAFTTVGDGVYSKVQICQTDEDGK